MRHQARRKPMPIAQYLFSLSRLRGRVGEGARSLALGHRESPLPNPPPKAGEGTRPA
jgi:hypothetical protein